MSVATLTADPEKRVRFEAFDTAHEIRQADGAVVGHYLPETEYQRLVYELARARCPITPEERERRRNEVGGCSLAEFWAKMGQAS